MSITALIVDDEELSREELKYLLDTAGSVDVLAEGRNGVEAVDLIRTHHPDVVFLGDEDCLSFAEIRPRGRWSFSYRQALEHGDRPGNRSTAACRLIVLENQLTPHALRIDGAAGWRTATVGMRQRREPTEYASNSYQS